MLGSSVLAMSQQSSLQNTIRDLGTRNNSKDIIYQLEDTRITEERKNMASYDVDLQLDLTENSVQEEE
mgnify:CR=1 FL=1|jgi:hypothetical protein